MANEPLLTLTDEENGVEVTVRSHAKGFSVVVRDTDADEFFPEVPIFPTYEAAAAYAARCA